MIFADIHIHALYGVDDGARNKIMMFKMIDAAYKDGTRVMCLTPHFHPGYYGDNHEKAVVSFGVLSEYVQEKYPDLKLYLGNELHYSKDCLSWLKEGICRTMNNTRYVLCDFNDKDSAEIIVKGMHKLLNAGYIPILAHAEIYKHLKLSQIGELVKSGVKIQIDMQSITGEFGFFIRKRANAILNARRAEVVCSDAHDLEKRPSQLNKCYQYLYKKFGKLYTRALVYDNAVKMLEATESGEN